MYDFIEAIFIQRRSLENIPAWVPVPAVDRKSKSSAGQKRARKPADGGAGEDD
jgi:hypothetical protein